METGLPALLSREETMRRFRWPALLAVCLLIVGFARTVPGTRIESAWGYRSWSFAALTYSDIIALHDDRGSTRHNFPYYVDRIEYPVLLSFAMYLPSLVAPGRTGYFALTYFLLSLCALFALWVVCAFPGTQPWALAASPALVVYTPLNWDFFGVLPTMLGLWWWAKGKERHAAAAFTVAVWTKFFPIFGLGVFALLALRRGLRPMLEIAAIFIAGTLLFNLPFIVPGGKVLDNWQWFFEYNRIRAIEPTLWSLLPVDDHAFVPAANAISGALAAAACAAIALLELRTRRVQALPAIAALTFWFFALNKVYSPQYWIWVVLFAALAGVPGWLAAALSAWALVDFGVIFGLLHLQMMRNGPILGWYNQMMVGHLLEVRYLLLFGCVGLTAWRVLGKDPTMPVSRPAAPQV